MSEDGFLGRWSRRKQAVREGRPLEAEPPPPAPAPVAVPAQGSAPAVQAQVAPAPEPAAAPAEPPPTLDDVQSLTPASDFSRFVQADVSPEVRNAAVKKLFADPHFNVMDGLDVYIDDYNKPDPLPASMARQLVGAQFLKLFEDEQAEAAAREARTRQTGEVAHDPTVQTVAQSAPPGAAAPDAESDPHADPDLRLQQDHAPGRAGPEPGAG